MGLVGRRWGVVVGRWRMGMGKLGRAGWNRGIGVEMRLVLRNRREGCGELWMDWERMESARRLCFERRDELMCLYKYQSAGTLELF